MQRDTASTSTELTGETRNKSHSCFETKARQIPRGIRQVQSFTPLPLRLDTSPTHPRQGPTGTPTSVPVQPSRSLRSGLHLWGTAEPQDLVLFRLSSLPSALPTPSRWSIST